MGKGVTFKLDKREFTETLRKYREYSKRDPETICNTKAFFIARRAVIETPRTTAQKIRGFITRQGGAIIGKIVNKRRGDRGEKGLYGDAMAKMVALVLAARLRSRAFLASGWVPAVKTLEPLAEKRGAPRADRTAAITGQAKGYATPARGAGWIAKTIIANLAAARWDTGGAQQRGQAALQRAFDAERASMQEYIERKMKESADRAGIKRR